MKQLRTLVFPALGLLSLVVVACGGGGGASSSSLPHAKAAAGHGTLAFTLNVPAAPASATSNARVRKAFAVSSSTQGLVVQAYVSPYTGTSTPVAVGTFDVSSMSPLCATSSNQSRVCSTSLSVPAGSYDLQVVNYDAAPVGGSIPATAHQLGYGFLANETVTAGATNSFSLTVEGIPYTLGVTVPVPHLHALDALTQVASVVALDAAGSVIMGPYIDAQGNTLTVTMSDGAGTGLLSFSPSTFTASQSTGVAVTYNPSAITTTQMTNGITANVVASLSNGAIASASLSAPAPEVTYAPGVFASSGPSGITTGPDGKLWVALYNSSSVGNLDPKTGLSSSYSGSFGSIAPVPRPLRIASDGTNLWFTAYVGSGVGELATSGTQVAAYSTPAFASKPFGIAWDGTQMWITEFAHDAIASVSTSGTVVETLLPSPAPRSPEDIIVGPDGKLWWVENAANTIATAPTTNTSTAAIGEYPIPTVSAAPRSLCSGPDGRVWFGESNQPNIGVATVSGSITEVPVSGISGSFYCTAGDDGNVWYVVMTSSGKEALLRVIPSTVATAGTTPVTSMFTLAGTPSVLSVIKGPDGNLWMTDNAGNALIRVQP